MAGDGAPPSRPQIERQLMLMLEDPLFQSRAQQAKILKCLVTRTLDGQDVAEESIRAEVFAYGYEEESTVVRRTIDLLKKSLLQYYEAHMTEALVVIHLPEQQKGQRIKFQAGEAYKPRFAFNINHPISKQYALGCQYLRSGFFNALPEAADCFSKILDSEPLHLGSLVNLCDTLCMIELCGLMPHERDRLIETADLYAKVAEKLAPSNWHTVACRALVDFCKGDIEGAGEGFAHALALSREDTENSPTYLHFLAMTDCAKGLQLTETMTSEHISNVAAHVLHAVHLTLHERFDEAQQEIDLALKLERNSHLANIVAIRLNLARGRIEAANHHVERLKALLDEDELLFWLATIRRLHPDR